jgi:NAD(P)-dependent dehydrogenase (short-subunit alcohol dehydrogenase family)
MSLNKESVAVVTGAASGIGRALAVRLARERIAGIAIADVNAEGLAETAGLLSDYPGKVTSHSVDVSNAEAMREFADEVARSHGRVTHVINNAGVALAGTIKEATLEEIHWLMGINFWGVVHGTKFFMPYLEKESSAHIVNVSSLFGLIAPPGNGAYCASKFAVRGFTEALRHELAGTNIAVSVVHPGGIRTNIVNNARISGGVTMSPREIEARKTQVNKNLDRTTPDEAAEIIVSGVKARQPRIIVGSDARILSFIARVFPRRYLGVMNLISGGRLNVT